MVRNLVFQDGGDCQGRGVIKEDGGPSGIELRVEQGDPLKPQAEYSNTGRVQIIVLTISVRNDKYLSG